MIQYHIFLKAILDRGTYKPAAREGLAGSISLFGYQYRTPLELCFPLITTKKMYFKTVAVEMLWFLKGDSNIKYLVDNGVSIWNKDAYNYYVEKCKADNCKPISFEKFPEAVRQNKTSYIDGYKYGDCGNMYPSMLHSFNGVNQIEDLLYGLKNHPESRRHILTVIDPSKARDTALYWCTAMKQFNCRPISLRQRIGMLTNINPGMTTPGTSLAQMEMYCNKLKVPTYYLDCNLYQRSADAFLGVPYDAAHYALLTCFFAKLVNMIPGDFIHSFGDAHIYDNHLDQVNLLLSRPLRKSPKLVFGNELNMHIDGGESLEFILKHGEPDLYKQFIIQDYDPHEAIPAPLSIGKN